MQWQLVLAAAWVVAALLSCAPAERTPLELTATAEALPIVIPTPDATNIALNAQRTAAALAVQATRTALALEPTYTPRPFPTRTPELILPEGVN